jgi:hypothetical protein
MTTAGLVINSGQYNLSTPYTKIFGEDGENSKESVFEVQATATPNSPTQLGVQYASIMGVRGTGIWNLGWGWNTPSVELHNTYEENDPRRTRTIMYTSRIGMNGDNDTIYQTIYGENIPLNLPNPRYNHKVYSNPSIRTAINHMGGYWMNIRILRFADVVLMYAEAANEINNTTEALEKLESVRNRARNGNNTILPEITTTDQDELRDAIRHERRVELAMEHDRFFDIVRWGIAADMLHAAGKVNFSNSRDILLPIPQVQIDLSNGVLTQNPGY